MDKETEIAELAKDSYDQGQIDMLLIIRRGFENSSLEGRRDVFAFLDGVEAMINDIHAATQ